MKEIEWHNEKEFSVDGVDFRCALDDNTLRTDQQRIIILKDRSVLDNYREVFAGTPVSTMLEFGIFQGGSPTLFSLLFGLDKFVGVDLCSPVESFDAFCARHPVGRKISSHYSTSQTDKDRIDAIVHAEFGNAPLDVIVDDASHLYLETRRTFEIAFPHLRPGGTYVVEDWGWAHWPESPFFKGRSAMSIFVMELVMICASRNDLISEVRIFPSFAFVKKAAQAPEVRELSLDSLYSKRGLEIFGLEDVERAGLAKWFKAAVTRNPIGPS
jgi:hypothetical protein